MGGQGSGRKPDQVKRLIGLNQPVGNTGTNTLFLPNVSGIKPAARNQGKYGDQGSVLFLDANGDITTDTSNLYWDDTNNRLGIGTTTPSSLLELSGASSLTMSGNARVYKNLFIRPAGLGVGGAAPASATVNASGFSILEFADSADDYAQVTINTPSDMDVTAASEIKMPWSVPNTSANMTWGYGYCVAGENETTEGTPTTGSTVVTSSGTANGKTSDIIFTIPANTLAAGDLLQIYFYRDVSEDTYGNPVDVHGLVLKYTANKLGLAL